ncbi:MAG: DUF302 domain-containing protein [Paracoccaceae bacterium]
MNFLKITAICLAIAMPAQADLITKASPYSVSETADNLVAAVEAAGAKVVARVNHAAAANSVNMNLRPTEMVMFGNPKLGTPAMQAAQVSGLDLPLRVVIWQAEDSTVYIAYHDPMELVALGIPADAKVLKMMAGALDKLTNAAMGE